MKRKVLCFFSLLLIILVFLTFVSSKAEEEMFTLVEARTGEAKNSRYFMVGLIAIEWPSSNDKLFEIVEGVGWESGLRIAEIPSDYFDHGPGHVNIGAGKEYWYVHSASREPVSGDPVKVVEKYWGDDTYLIWHPETLENLTKPSNSMDIVAQADNVALISNWGSMYPFFEHNVWFKLKENLGEELRVYSLHDVKQLIFALPWIAGVISMLLCSIILWGTSWILSNKIGYSKKTVAMNVLIIAVLLGCVPLILHLFDLPASLMPKESILDIAHYAETFDRITASMNVLGDPSVRNWFILSAILSAVIIGLTVAATSFLVFAEAKGCNLRAKGKTTPGEKT